MEKKVVVDEPQGELSIEIDTTGDGLSTDEVDNIIQKAIARNEKRQQDIKRLLSEQSEVKTGVKNEGRN